MLGEYYRAFVSNGMLWLAHIVYQKSGYWAERGQFISGRDTT